VEVAVREGNAAHELGMAAGDKVLIRNTQ